MGCGRARCAGLALLLVSDVSKRAGRSGRGPRSARTHEHVNVNQRTKGRKKKGRERLWRRQILAGGGGGGGIRSLDEHIETLAAKTVKGGGRKESHGWYTIRTSAVEGGRLVTKQTRRGPVMSLSNDCKMHSHNVPDAMFLCLSFQMAAFLVLTHPSREF